jgi:hypothetical protein
MKIYQLTRKQLRDICKVLGLPRYHRPKIDLVLQIEKATGHDEVQDFMWGWISEDAPASSTAPTVTGYGEPLSWNKDESGNLFAVFSPHK